MLVFCRFAALRTDTVRQLQEVHRMKKRTRRRPARHFHPLGIVLLAALAISSSLALWTRAMDALSERDAFSAEDNAAPPDTAPVGNAQGDLILVNADASYDPETAEDLVSVYEEKNSSYYVKDTALSVCRRVMTPLNDWMADFEAATGCSNVNIVAGYRTQDDQQQLYDAAVQNHGSDYAASYLAQPGCSEHHTGLAVDFALYLEASGATADFTGTGDYAWLVEHAWEYGFIRRYPENKRDVTGIAYEAWHFRYVGVPHAWYMQENGLCLEEYLQLLREKASEAAPLRFTCQAIAYAVYAAASPPAGGAADCSADNLGGYIVTVTE